MAKLIEFLQAQAKKAGVDINADDFKAFFATEGIQNVEVPDKFVTPIDQNLISLAAAKDDFPVLKSHYYAQALDGVDKTFDEVMKDAGLSQDDINDLKLERSTHKRAKLLFEKVSAAEKKKANADKPDRKKIDDEIAGLHAQLRSEKDRADGVEKTFAQKEKDMRIGYRLQESLSKHKTSLDELTPEAKRATLQSILNIELQQKNAKLDFDTDGNLILVKTDGGKYFGDNNLPVSPDAFIESSLSRNKLLAVNKPAATQTNQGGNTGTQFNGQPNGADQKNGGKLPVGKSSVFQELMTGATNDFKKGSQNGFGMPGATP